VNVKSCMERSIFLRLQYHVTSTSCDTALSASAATANSYNSGTFVVYRNPWSTVFSIRDRGPASRLTLEATNPPILAEPGYFLRG
jgi:hypothetical protein